MISRIRLIFIIFTASVATVVQGQSVSDSARISLGYPVYSQYIQNGLVINPAYAGSRGALSTFLSYRMQWMGISGSPVFQSVSLHTPMKNDKVALGLLGQFMQYGFTKSTSIYASYAYRIKLGTGKISFGLKAGADMTNTVYPNNDADRFLTTPNDPVFVNDKAWVLPNVGAGVYYFSDKIFAGMSVPAFLSYRRTATGTLEPYHSFGEYNIILTGGGLITFSDFVKFKPSMLLNYSFHDTKRINQLDINGNLILGDLIWIGGSWRTSEQVAVGILQVQINPQLMFGFSYDNPMGRMSSYSKGSSEFILRYEFGYKVSAGNPRYF
ncbi:MAG TPA: type IX secretion system membrane protein PorP/SprF [Bacteroidales bacterium]|nr:type IX secretion system membrane protein PorP/SprF [Bacteroidales bacterium]